MRIAVFVIGSIITAALLRTGILNETSGPIFAIASIAFILFIGTYAWLVQG